MIVNNIFHIYLGGLSAGKLLLPSSGSRKKLKPIKVNPIIHPLSSVTAQLCENYLQMQTIIVHHSPMEMF